MENLNKKIIYDEQGLKPGSDYEKGQWKNIAVHNDKEVRGFFGEYRFLNNFWPARVILEDDEYHATENAYQASKYKKEMREYFKTCTPKEAVAFVRDNPMGIYTREEWDKVKLEIMRKLLEQKFDKNLNPENYKKLIETGDKYLEETNYWEDKYWGVSKIDASENGIGENNLGKLLMEIRSEYHEARPHDI